MHNLLKRDTVLLCISLHQFESHSASRQIVERVMAVIPFGIQDGNCLREGFVGKMVVANDEVNAPVLCVKHLLHRLDTAVECYYKCVAPLVCPINSLV